MCACVCSARVSPRLGGGSARPGGRRRLPWVLLRLPETVEGRALLPPGGPRGPAPPAASFTSSAPPPPPPSRQGAGAAAAPLARWACAAERGAAAGTPVVSAGTSVALPTPAPTSCRGGGRAAPGRERRAPGRPLRAGRGPARPGPAAGAGREGAAGARRLRVPGIRREAEVREGRGGTPRPAEPAGRHHARAASPRRAIGAPPWPAASFEASYDERISLRAPRVVPAAGSPRRVRRHAARLSRTPGLKYPHRMENKTVRLRAVPLSSPSLQRREHRSWEPKQKPAGIEPPLTKRVMSLPGTGALCPLPVSPAW